MSDSKKTLSVAFLFPGSRDKIISQVRKDEGADTSLWGMNHIPGARSFISNEYRGVRILLLLAHLLRYDFVIAQDNFLLGYIVSLYAHIFRLRTRWLYFTMTSSTLIRRHADHPIRLFLLKIFWASYARIICLSSEQIEDFARLGIARERLVHIPFGVDADFFQSTDVSSEEEMIASVGRDAGRDYATLFAAAEQVNCAFSVIATHKNIPPDMPIPRNVSVFYDQSPVEVRDLYKRARLVVIASKNVLVPEGSDCSGQTVIMDALASRKAVITTNRPWIADYFIPGRDIVVVEPNNSESLAQAINALLHDEEKRKSLALSGHNAVVTKYTTEIFAKSLLKLMESIV